jgi:substrate-binding family protein
MAIAAASPRIPARVLARFPGSCRPPGGHTAAELTRLVQLLEAAGAGSIAIGHGRHPGSVAAAGALATAWAEVGGTVLGTVSYPADAASWLRPARRLASLDPDAWVIADSPAGLAQLSRRLAGQPGWAPGRTFAFSSAASADLIPLGGPGALTGLVGATTDGGSWHVGSGLLVRYPPAI